MQITEDRYLQHFGVKGMKWGIRKEEETTGTPSYEDRVEQFDKNHNLPPKKKGWRPTGKQVAIAAGGAAFIAAVAGVVLAKNNDAVKEVVETIAGPGDKISLADYQERVSESTRRSWGGIKGLTELDMSREEMTLPAGHTFSRLSSQAEETWNNITYASHSPEDRDRYLSSFVDRLSGYGAYDIGFTANKPIRVPSTSQMLSAYRDAYSAARGVTLNDSEVVREYAKSTGFWNPEVKSVDREFFSRLMSAGFHAIFDDMDAGVYSESPLVIFDPSAFSAKIPKLLEQPDFDLAATRLIEINNRK